MTALKELARAPRDPACSTDAEFAAAKAKVLDARRRAGMTSNADTAARSSRALRAAVDGDRATLADAVHRRRQGVDAGSVDVVGARSCIAELDRRDDAFSDIELDVTPLDVGGDYACAEWRVTMTHTGDARSSRDGGSCPPTASAHHDQRRRPSPSSDGDRICALRQYWDELAVYEQLGLVGEIDD